MINQANTNETSKSRNRDTFKVHKQNEEEEKERKET